jgi:hypothetical protein
MNFWMRLGILVCLSFLFAFCLRGNEINVWQNRCLLGQCLCKDRYIGRNKGESDFGVVGMVYPVPMDLFLFHRQSEIYSVSRSSPAHRLQPAACSLAIPKYRSLFYRWALHSIPRLQFLHFHVVIHDDLRGKDFWLREDLPLVIGPLFTANFTDAVGVFYRRTGYKSCLLKLQQKDFAEMEDWAMGRIVKKWWEQGCENADGGNVKVFGGQGPALRRG